MVWAPDSPDRLAGMRQQVRRTRHGFRQDPLEEDLEPHHRRARVNGFTMDPVCPPMPDFLKLSVLQRSSTETRTGNSPFR